MIGVLDESEVLATWRALAELANEPLPSRLQLGGVVLRASWYPVEAIASQAGLAVDRVVAALLVLEAHGVVRCSVGLDGATLRVAPGAGDSFDAALFAARGW